MNQPSVKETIIDSFLEMSSVMGLKKITIDMLAKKCHISKKTIYTHFKNKNEIVKCTSDRLFSQLRERASELHGLGNAPLETMNTFFDFLFEIFGNAPALVFHDIKIYFPEIQNELNQIIENISALSVKSLQKGGEMGIYNDVDPKITIAFMTGAAKAVINADFILTNNFTINQVIASYKKLALSGLLNAKEEQKINNE